MPSLFNGVIIRSFPDFQAFYFIFLSVVNADFFIRSATSIRCQQITPEIQYLSLKTKNSLWKLKSFCTYLLFVVKFIGVHSRSRHRSSSSVSQSDFAFTYDIINIEGNV